jgi:uncharacterized protein (TIGR00255 family)
MIRSMTGYGDATRVTPAGVLRAEVRTVNHRYFSANLRLARAVERYETQIRDWLRALLPRGHVNFSLRVERDDLADADSGGVRVDEVRARMYARALRTLKERLELPGEVDVALLARFGDLIVPEDDVVAPEFQLEAIREATQAAAHAAVEMRIAEGERLGVDLEERLRAIEDAIAVIAARAPERLVAERDRMRRVVTELLGDLKLDGERVAREIAMLAERWDISEELVRLRSHIALFRETVADAAEPVGKRLGFLIQEMNRETNTIGAKANDAPIEHRVIAVKDEIERLREQVENVE